MVDIVEGAQKPYYIKSEGIDAGTYIRVAGTTRPADEYMIQELRLEGSRRSYDEMPCIGVEITEDDIADLCKRMKEEAVYNTLDEEEKKQSGMLQWSSYFHGESLVKETESIIQIMLMPS